MCYRTLWCCWPAKPAANIISRRCMEPLNPVNRLRAPYCVTYKANSSQLLHHEKQLWLPTWPERVSFVDHRYYVINTNEDLTKQTEKNKPSAIESVHVNHSIDHSLLTSSCQRIVNLYNFKHVNIIILNKNIHKWLLFVFPYFARGNEHAYLNVFFFCLSVWERVCVCGNVNGCSRWRNTDKYKCKPTGCMKNEPRDSRTHVFTPPTIYIHTLQCIWCCHGPVRGFWVFSTQQHVRGL